MQVWLLARGDVALSVTLTAVSSVVTIFPLPWVVNLAGLKAAGQPPSSPQTLIASMAQAELTWDTLRRVRDHWPHFLVVKGVLDPDIAVPLRR